MRSRKKTMPHMQSAPKIQRVRWPVPMRNHIRGRVENEPFIGIRPATELPANANNDVAQRGLLT